MNDARTLTLIVADEGAPPSDTTEDDLGEQPFPAAAARLFWHRPKDVPLDTLKIDRSFVSRIGEADENGEIVRTIVTLAENLGMDVVAEGIETLGQLSELKRLNCRYGQGYLFARPLNATAATAWISNTPHVLGDLFSPRADFVPAHPPMLQLRAV